MKFKSDIEVQAGLRDGSDDIGTAGQILSSTGSQTNWIDQGTIISAASKLVVIACKNTSGATITKGTPVYQTGTVGATDVIEIAEADASDEDKMAAIGLLQTDINNNDFGNVVITGELLNFTTSPIDGVTPTTGDTIYVKSGGGLTLTKPTGLEFIQNVGLVGKVSGGNAGSITVSSIMRSNDVPTPLYIDHDNQRLGIGTTSPSERLDVKGALRVDSELSSNNIVINGGDSNNLATITSRGNGISIITGTNFGTAHIKLLPGGSGNVGIGTTSPGTKLQVEGSIQANAQGRFKGWYTSGSGLALETGVSGGNGYVLTYNRDTSAYSSTIIESTGIQFVAHSSGKFYFTGGNVGIGYTNPSEKLSVDGTFGVSDLPFNTDSVSVLVADETIGADLVTNGDFATNTDWTEQGGAAAWSIANGKANCVVNSIIRYFEQPNVLPSTGAGNTYKVVYTISGITQGGFAINVGGYGSTPVRTANGTYAETFTITYASSNNRIYLQSSPNTIGSIDNVSVQLVTSASNQIQKRELGTGAFGPTPVGAYLPLTAGSGSPLTGDLYIEEDSLYLLNASNNYWRVQNNSSGKLTFKQGTTQRGIWSSGELQLANNLIVDGNVGIGITSPGDKLHVEGGIIIQNGNNLQWGGLYSAAAPTIYGATNYLQFVPTGSSGSGYRQMRLDTTGLGIGTSSPSEKLDVAGNIKIQAALLSNQENTDIDSAAAEVVAQVAHATYTAAFFDFVVKKGTNVRSGTVYACHNGDTTPLVEFTETSTNDLGDTSDVTLSVDISGANMRLLATVTSDDWSVKSLIRAI